MKFIPILIASAVISTQSHAATLSFSMLTDTGAATSLGVPLSSVFTMYIGNYTGPIASTLTFADIDANFTSIPSATTPFASGAATGFAGYVDTGGDISYTDALGVSGLQTWVWFTDGGDNNALITGFAALPGDTTIPNTQAYAIDSTNINSLTIELGSYDPLGVNVAGSGGNIVLNNAIPETSTLLLSAIGVVALLRRKR